MVAEDVIRQIEEDVKSKVIAASETIIPEIKQEILEQKKKSFTGKGANDWDQTPFPELQPSTVKRKRKYPYPENPLHRTGDLQNDLHMSEDLNDFDAHSDLEYSSHLKEWEKVKNSPHPFDELTDKEYDHVLDEIEKRLQDAFNQ